MAVSSSARPRDRLIDLLRAISITRVVFIHIMRHSALSFWPAPTFFIPGMPVIFFVSGSLAYRSLQLKEGVRRAAAVYWKRTYRRLLLPYWAFYATMASIAIIGDLLSDSDQWRVRWPAVLWGFTGLTVPRPAPVVSSYIGHVWFMSVFLVMAFLAPCLVRLFDRAKWALLAAMFTMFITVQVVEMGVGVRIPNELDALSMFSVMYVIGFFYTEGTIKAAKRWQLISVTALAAVGAAIYNSIYPGSVNISEPKHLMVGMAWLFVALAVAPTLSSFADRHSVGLALITRRTFTAYLWGWPTCKFAAYWSKHFLGKGWDYRALMAVMALVLLGVAILAYGWVEDRSSKTPGSLGTQPVM